MRARFDRRVEGLHEPASVILLDELPSDNWDVDDWDVEGRSLPTVQLLLERLLAIAKAGGMRELVAEAPQHDEWLARAYRQAGFSQTARDSVLESRKQI